MIFFPRRRWRDWRASWSPPLANNQDGDSGKKRVPNRKVTSMQTTKDPSKDVPLDKTADIMYVIRMPSANEEAVNDPSLPRIFILYFILVFYFIYKPVNLLSLIMAADLKKTSKCHYTRTIETFWGQPIYTMLRKNSPYTDMMTNDELLEWWARVYKVSNLNALFLFFIANSNV